MSVCYICGGFKKTGIMPFDPTAIDVAMTRPSEVFSGSLQAAGPSGDTPLDELLAARRGALTNAIGPPRRRARGPNPHGGRAIAVPASPASTPAEPDDICCQCSGAEPPHGSNSSPPLQIDWAQCDRCQHWVHLQCAGVPSIIVDDNLVTYFCPCC